MGEPTFEEAKAAKDELWQRYSNDDAWGDLIVAAGVSKVNVIAPSRGNDARWCVILSLSEELPPDKSIAENHNGVPVLCQVTGHFYLL